MSDSESDWELEHVLTQKDVYGDEQAAYAKMLFSSELLCNDDSRKKLSKYGVDHWKLDQEGKAATMKFKLDREDGRIDEVLYEARVRFPNFDGGFDLNDYTFFPDSKTKEHMRIHPQTGEWTVVNQALRDTIKRCHGNGRTMKCNPYKIMKTWITDTDQCLTDAINAIRSKSDHDPSSSQAAASLVQAAEQHPQAGQIAANRAPKAVYKAVYGHRDEQAGYSKMLLSSELLCNKDSRKILSKYGVDHWELDKAGNGSIIKFKLDKGDGRIDEVPYEARVRFPTFDHGFDTDDFTVLPDPQTKEHMRIHPMTGEWTVVNKFQRERIERCDGTGLTMKCNPDKIMTTWILDADECLAKAIDALKSKSKPSSSPTPPAVANESPPQTAELAQMPVQQIAIADVADLTKAHLCEVQSRKEEECSDPSKPWLQYPKLSLPKPLSQYHPFDLAKLLKKHRVQKKHLIRCELAGGLFDYLVPTGKVNTQTSLPKYKLRNDNIRERLDTGLYKRYRKLHPTTRHYTLGGFQMKDEAEQLQSDLEKSEREYLCSDQSDEDTITVTGAFRRLLRGKIAMPPPSEQLNKCRAYIDAYPDSDSAASDVTESECELDEDNPCLECHPNHEHRESSDAEDIPINSNKVTPATSHCQTDSKMSEPPNSKVALKHGAEHSKQVQTADLEAKSKLVPSATDTIILPTPVVVMPIVNVPIPVITAPTPIASPEVIGQVRRRDQASASSNEPPAQRQRVRETKCSKWCRHQDDWVGKDKHVLAFAAFLKAATVEHARSFDRTANTQLWAAYRTYVASTNQECAIPDKQFVKCAYHHFCARRKGNAIVFVGVRLY